MNKSTSNEKCNICDNNFKTKILVQKNFTQVRGAKKDKTSKIGIINIQ